VVTPDEPGGAGGAGIPGAKSGDPGQYGSGSTDIAAADLDGDGTADVTRRFYRLLGDVNGDGKVNVTDRVLVSRAVGRFLAARPLFDA
jgi:hypothetical protein